MLERLKNALKFFLPPPVRAFNREIERILAAISDERKEMHQERKQLEDSISARLDALSAEQSSLLREESRMLAQQIQETQQMAIAHLMHLNESQATHTDQLSHLAEKIALLSKENAVMKEALSIAVNQSERNVLQKIDREKQELFYEYYSRLKPEDYEREIALWYRKKTGKMLNLQNPATFNEKIQWMKLYDSTPLKTKLTDKYEVRDWVKAKIGEEYLIPLLGVWDNFDEIDFERLPNKFVLKANHGCGWNVVVTDKGTFNKKDARRNFADWMKRNFAFMGLELQYMNIRPKIIAEAYLENVADDLYDYKVFCFGGKAESIMFLCERKHGLKMAFYDLQWNKLPYTYNFPTISEDVPKPQNLDHLIRLAETLADGFPHVRVDFYVLNDGTIKFSEMTFSSANGMCRWNLPEQDLKYGRLIQLPAKSAIPTLDLQAH